MPVIYTDVAKRGKRTHVEIKRVQLIGRCYVKGNYSSRLCNVRANLLLRFRNVSGSTLDDNHAARDFGQTYRIRPATVHLLA